MRDIFMVTMLGTLKVVLVWKAILAQSSISTTVKIGEIDLLWRLSTREFLYTCMRVEEGCFYLKGHPFNEMNKYNCKDYRTLYILYIDKTLIQD